MKTEDWREISGTIPTDPGVYRFINPEDVIIYVGKAKNLKNRLSSYFGDRSDMAHKTRVMVKLASRIEYTIVDTEQDALLLENTLIKKLQPRYNVMLRDDKNYTYICIKNEPFPRVFFTRRVVRDGSQYFGPYTSKARIKLIMDLIKVLFPLRTCSLPLTQANISKGKFKVCLEYHVKNCMGPCAGLESPEVYDVKIQQIRNILKGHFGMVRQHFSGLMQEHAANLAFEQAQDIKMKLDALEDYQSKSMVVNPQIEDVDVFSFQQDDKNAYVNYLKIVNGAIINTHTLELTKNLDEEAEDILFYAITVLREKFNSISPEVIVPFEVPAPDARTRVQVPKIGDKKKLLELSQKNLSYYILQKKSLQTSRVRKMTPSERILNTLKEDLQMEFLPMHIECFDNSNIQGSNPVSSCVVFRNAKPSKKDYRHFHVRTVEGPNDFASMEEVVYRRYKRMLDESQALPDLIIIDGGKGQLSSALQSLEKLGIQDKVRVIGIAKKLEEIYFPGDSLPLYINKKSESLKLIQQIRNEAHRFAISFHRETRSKDMVRSALDGIPGIGKVSAEKLLKQFGSVARIQAATEEEWAKVAGKRAAESLKKHFSGSDAS